ncbi:hypothetical protein AAG747_15885 [Rapidithrix thailandica]|uniref:Uncharacterized protein n=1 Tax=Rapidithrix thailandica TaxID=413964 RepID=A0AAW9SA93_9BACT
MDQEELQAIVLKTLSESYPQEVDLRIVLKTYGVYLTPDELEGFMNHRLVTPGYVNIGSKAYCFSATQMGLEFGESVSLDLPDPEKHRKDGPVLPFLVPHHWPKRQKFICEPLILRPGHPDIPVIVYGYQKEDGFELDGIEVEEDITLEELRNQSLQNLPSEDVSVEELVVEEYKMLEGSGPFAAEKILEKGCMKELQNRLQAKQIAVAIPAKESLFLINAQAPERVIRKFKRKVTAIFEAQERNNTISQTIFTVQEGEITGILNLPEMAEKKTHSRGTFLRKLLGRGE